jgi:hypothetical protein
LTVSASKLNLSQISFSSLGAAIFNSNIRDRDEMSNLYRGHSIDASYQVSVHLAKRFQRRFKKIGQSETKIACGSPKWIKTW